MPLVETFYCFCVCRYALENDYFQENNERKHEGEDIDGWKSYKIEDNDFDETIVHKVSFIMYIINIYVVSLFGFYSDIEKFSAYNEI